MGAKKVAKRSKVKPFIKTVNYNHLMPTRYTLELEGLKGTVTNDTFKEVSQREDAKKVIKKSLEDRYTSGKNRWFFTPLSTLCPTTSIFALVHGNLRCVLGPFFDEMLTCSPTTNRILNVFYALLCLYSPFNGMVLVMMNTSSCLYA